MARKRTVLGANGKQCEVTTGSCSCCGASSHPADATRDAWYVYRAGWVDCDGVYMARLCGDRDGAGCISEVTPGGGPRQMAAEILGDLYGNDLDGIQADMEDLGDMLG